MQDTDIKEIGLHLRKIQLLITVTIVGLIIFNFGYRNPQIGTALKELQFLEKMSEAWLPDGPKDSRTLLVLRTSWNSALEKIPVTDLQEFDTEGNLKSSNSLPEFAPTTSDNLDDCSGYSNIFRSRYNEHTKMLKEKDINSIECVWLSEDDLFTISLTLPPSGLNWKLVTLSDENDTPVSRQSDSPITITSNSTKPAGGIGQARGIESLDDCADWNEIARLEFTQFTDALKKLEWQGPVLCAWEGEDDLLIASGKFNRGEKYIVTDTDIEPIDSLGLDWAKPFLRRIEGQDLSTCAGTSRGEDSGQSYSRIIDKFGDDALMCYWINPNALIVARIAWKKLPDLMGRQELRSYIGKEYTRAFPELFSLEGTNGWTVKDSVDEIRTQLERQRIQLDEDMSILGVPLKGNILLTGGPVLLIVLQLYFLVHYRQLLNWIRERKGNLPPVPWIGVYHDFLARLIMILTLFLMPPSAILLLWSYVGSSFFLCVAAISTAISLWQGRLIWSSWSLRWIPFDTKNFGKRIIQSCQNVLAGIPTLKTRSLKRNAH